jgi:hypothetical protein
MLITNASQSHTVLSCFLWHKGSTTCTTKEQGGKEEGAVSLYERERLAGFKEQCTTRKRVTRLPRYRPGFVGSESFSCLFTR